MEDGDDLVLIGGDGVHLAQSIYLRELFGRADGPPPPVDLAAEKRHGDFVRAAIRSGEVNACHDISDGGLAIALAELCMASGVGASVTLATSEPHAELFGEDQARYVVAARPDYANWLVINAEGDGIPARRIGSAGGDRLKAGDLLSVAIAELRSAHESWFPRFMDGPALLAEAAE
jgi:phosphoribosylformylglycinamidine synthase